MNAKRMMMITSLKEVCVTVDYESTDNLNLIFQVFTTHFRNVRNALFSTCCNHIIIQ